MTDNSYTTATKFENVVGYPILIDQLVSVEEQRRIMKEFEHWKMYKGKHWRTRRPEGEPQVTANYCRAFVDKGVAFLMGKGFSIKTKNEAMNVTKPVLDEVWDDNNRELLGLDMGQSGGVTGNTWVKVTVEHFDPDTQPDKYEEYPKGRIRLIVLPSYSTFPTWDGHDKDTMVRCKIIYPIHVEREKPDGSIDRETHIFREEITRDRIREYLDNELIEERENPIGEIPVIGIKNLPVSGEPFGASDIEDIVPLQHEFNAKTTDVSDIINYHAAPITVIFGAKAKDLQKGARKVWAGLPKDGKVENLELQTDLSASLNYIELIRTAMFELASMPEDAFGKDMNISNTSGIALHIRNQPLIELTRTKWVTYGEGIRKINKMIIKFAKLIEHPSFKQDEFDKLPANAKYWTEAEFPNPLPKDELIEMQLISQKLKNLLLSRRDALVELGISEPDKKLEEILAETTKVEQVLATAQELSESALEQLSNEAMATNVGGIIHPDEKAKEGIDSGD